jgi:hypothetical protein
MRFTSLVIELIRARPRLVVWLVIVLQAILWLLISLILYRGPPGDLATVLALGREYRVGTDLGPPLAFWLADVAFRAAGNHMLGVYVLAQLCSVATFWVIYLLARAAVGGQQAVLAVLLTMTVLAFGAPSLEFGPLILARPLWALLLLHSWQLIGQNRRNAWFGWSIEAGLLLLTTSAAIVLLALVVGFALATARGRRTLMSFDALFALLVILVLALPYLIWLIRADASILPHWPSLADLGGRTLHGVELLGGLLLAALGVAIVSAFNSAWFDRSPEEAPAIFRPPVDPAMRDFVYFFAVVPALLGCLLSGLFGLDHVVGGTGIVLSMSGLAVVVACGDLIHLRRQQILRTVWAAMIFAPALGVIAAILFVPWTTSSEVTTSLPATAIARFFDDSYERRTNQRLSAVSGDAQLATLVSLSPTRPHLFLAASPERTPWFNLNKFNQTGGVVVWRASDTDGTPPPDIARLFPGLGPEVPQTFDRLVNGRQSLLRIGWAIVRPKGP